MQQSELYEAIGIELLKVKPEPWQNVKNKITHIPVDDDHYKFEFEISSPEGHTDIAKMTQELIDSTVDFYEFCNERNQAWTEVIVRIYMDKKLTSGSVKPNTNMNRHITKHSTGRYDIALTFSHAESSLCQTPVSQNVIR